jgi:predicted phage-related endonuclease
MKFVKEKIIMSTVEIIVMFEDCRRKQEEEKQKQEEMRICAKIKQLQELEELMDEAKSEAEKIKDEIKMEMKKRNTEEMKVGQYIVRWTEVISNRFDTTGFKKLFPEVYKEFTKQSASRRFTISG